jgi:hypothetical protein
MSELVDRLEREQMKRAETWRDSTPGELIHLWDRSEVALSEAIAEIERLEQSNDVLRAEIRHIDVDNLAPCLAQNRAYARVIEQMQNAMEDGRIAVALELGPHSLQAYDAAIAAAEEALR